MLNVHKFIKDELNKKLKKKIVFILTKGKDLGRNWCLVITEEVCVKWSEIL